MIGLFVRIKREGPHGPESAVDLDEMTDQELDALDDVMGTQEAWVIWTWTKALVRYIRNTRAREGSHGVHRG